MTALEILIGVIAGVFVNTNRVIDVVASVGVLVLLFEVGLSIDHQELLIVGRRAVAVAIVGVTASFAGGVAVMAAFGYETRTVLFVGAALTATSVGVAARVFRHPTVLGAAVVDDIIGLAILTVAGVGASVWNLNLVFAFALGLAIGQTKLQAQLVPLVTRAAHVLVPVFFFRVGLELEFDQVTRRAAAVGLCLFAVAVAAKLLAGVMAERDKFLVGLGMLPRGEVTLVFATTGLASGVLTPSLYAALVFVVVATTLAASLALRR